MFNYIDLYNFGTLCCCHVDKLRGNQRDIVVFVADVIWLELQKGGLQYGQADRVHDGFD
jgi:hypothetical protein